MNTASSLGSGTLPALADLGTSINLTPLSVWNKLSLPDLSPTCMTLELADRLISHPVGVAKDVFVKVGTFHFLADFVVVDFDADPRVPLILGRSFLKTRKALIDVFEGELTLRVGKEAITFSLNQTAKYSANYNDMMANQIDVIDMACEEYSQEFLGFYDVIASGNPTPYYDPIVSTTSPTLTPFGNSDFLIEEVDAFLALEDDPTSPEVDQSYLDTEGVILLLEAFLNDDPSLPPPNQRNYLPQDLPPHLEYAFLEGDEKLPAIIAKDLSMEEKIALITVLKSHKQAIAWKLSYIKGIDPEFYTHKILMEEDFEPVVQHQRRVNPKIHDVIKQEVLKLLDDGLIYPISDSSWVSPVHYVPKKGGFTVVENEENELILTRLVTGWRVCIDYRKLNEATRKDHFPLPFMDQMLERLTGNQYYCFLDGFSGGAGSNPVCDNHKAFDHKISQDTRWQILSTEGSKSNFSYDILDLKSNTQTRHEWDEVSFTSVSRVYSIRVCLYAMKTHSWLRTLVRSSSNDGTVLELEMLVTKDTDEDSMIESIMSEDATREALRMAKDTPVMEAGIKVEFLEEEGVVESDVALDFIYVLLEMVISKPRKDLRRRETGKMPRMAMSMGITGLSKNLLQMHVREECLHSNLKLVIYLKEMFGTGNLQ
nr:reverse transcriptase domain-containing protein [Tanacetum cinerariifolium]